MSEAVHPERVSGLAATRDPRTDSRAAGVGHRFLRPAAHVRCIAASSPQRISVRTDVAGRILQSLR